MDRLFPPKCPLVSKKDALIAEVPIIHGMTDEEALMGWLLMDMTAAKATSTMKETEQKDNETNWRHAQENHQASTHTIRVPAGREVLAPPHGTCINIHAPRPTRKPWGGVVRATPGVSNDAPCQPALPK